MTDDEYSSEAEVVPCSLATHHGTNRHITEINNATPHVGDTDGSDIESDHISKDNGEDTDYHNKDYNDMDNSDDVLVTNPTIRSRATDYNKNEILILACAWVQVSTDPAVDTDQKSVHFWNRVLITYSKFIAITNNKYSKKDGELYTLLPEDHTIKSLKSQWYNQLLPIASKFSAIEEMNPPNSGEQYDDGDLTSYYARHRNDIYPKQAGKLPKKSDQYIDLSRFVD